MTQLKYYFIFLTWICYLMISGLFLFINGFFLTRIARMERSNCTPCHLLDSCNVELILQNPQIAAEICLEPRARIVLLVVDALKYEFMEWQENSLHSSYYHNKIPIVYELLQKYPAQTRLFKSIVDPPTTTMQRLKALTTGTLPTFIDISSNFASEQIDEDNIIDQVSKRGIVFMGDDTWTSLYPRKFIRQFPSPSFNVWDLDTVDSEVRNRIFFELQKKDWTMLVAHTLGVDHCGHKHGQNHPEMERKLNETNTLIEEVIEVLDEGTVLFVIGDHGMTSSGDHGGDSSDEIEAAMFVYSKSSFNNHYDHRNQYKKIVNQIDIVPTLAAILGSPIPFSNIGSTIIDVIPSKSRRSDFWFDIHSIWRNVYQTKKYIDIYASESSLFTHEKIKELDQFYKRLAEEVKTVKNDESLKIFLEHSQEYLNVLRNACIEIWAQFDSNLMFKGLLLMFCTLFFSYIIINHTSRQCITEVLDSNFFKILSFCNAIALVILFVLYNFGIASDILNTILFTTGVVSLIFLVILTIQNWGVISITWHNNSRNNKFHYFTRIILLLTIFGLFSNSYIVEENKILSFLLITIIWLLIYNVWINFSEFNDKKYRAKKAINSYKLKILIINLGIIVCIAIRISSYFWRCREEQDQELCALTLSGKIGSIMSSSLERFLLTISLISLVLYITVARIWLRNCGNLAGFTMNVTVARYFPGVIVICMGCYWVLQRLPKNAKVKFVSSYQMDALPGLVYFFVACAIFIWFVQPLQIFLLPQKKKTLNLYQGENIVPILFDKVKELFYIKNKQDDIPIIYGLGTVYSAAFVSIAVFLILLYALLLGNILASSTFLIVVTCVAVLVIIAIERYRNAYDVSEFFQIPMSAILCWFLIAEYFFYGTGHQPSFSTIHWDAAFIGTGGHFYGNIIPTILIGINTFGSYMILAFIFPLMIIAPFTIYVMIPKLAKTCCLEDDMKRGELILIDKASLFHHAIFSATGKYLLVYGLRTFGCMFSATIHCQHLMVWKIFAPKFIFESLSFLVSVGSVLISLILVMRIDCNVEQLITRVTKVR